MKLKIKILLLAILPMLLVTILIAFLSTYQIHSLAEQEIKTFEINLVASKREELKNYVDLAHTSIKPVLEDTSLTKQQVESKVRKTLNSLIYDTDGYFFIYDQKGINIVHPISPELVGQNLYNIQDLNGNYLIRGLITQAQSGGGYHRYLWNKPSGIGVQDKMSYAILVGPWQWMMGTGLYLDDIETEVAHIRDQVKLNVRQTFIKTLFIVLVAIVVITLIGLAINLHETRLADKRLQQLALKFVRFQVNERRRFARDLHDGINQLLVAVKYKLESATNKIKRNELLATNDLEGCTDVLNDTIREIRRISHDLRPSLLDDLGLERAILNLLDQFEERTNIHVIAEIDLEAGQVPEDIEITLYRLIHEALTNIERHSQATRVQLIMWMERKRLKFTLSDNGIGFSPKSIESSPSGIGLKNMQERVELIGGHFTIRSKENEGTTIRTVFLIEE
ncbi:cache domain-containing protein [Leucothrix arctica]|uniref:Histidine kinase n=1 Tax=Leucothrix arctica TaxID=1481894 RepID=A0A317CF55_9GAMM|nr:cache domain-containing protein [Leucothrix arctica]PWQ97275.1 histidine kinase [Leucothrix arctica]